MLTGEEVELLATLLARAGVNAYEAAWANTILDKLRVLAAAQAKAQKKQEEDTQATADPPAE